MTSTKKLTVAGPVPKEWDAKLIKDCCEVVRGASPRPAGDPRYFDGDYLPWITVADVTGKPGMYLEGTRTKLTKEGASFTRHIPPETLIITNSGATLGVPKITQELSGANDGIAVFLNLRGISKECLFYILESKTDYFRNELAPGVGQPNLNTELLGDVAIPIPPAGEQERIVGALSTWDTAIQKTEQLIAAKERHRNALIQRLYALSDHCGNASRFRELLEESMEAGNSGRHAKKITVKLYGKGVLAKEAKRQGSEQTQYFVRRAGQLIYSKLDFLNGAFGIVPPELDGYESTLDLPTFDIAPTVNPVWLLGYLTRPTYYTRQVGLARGQRKARRVHPSDLLASSLRVPPRDLQDRIAEILTSSQCDINRSRRLLDSLKIQRRGLMQKLLTGEWRVKADYAGAAKQAKEVLNG